MNDCQVPGCDVCPKWSCCLSSIEPSRIPHLGRYKPLGISDVARDQDVALSSPSLPMDLDPGLDLDLDLTPTDLGAFCNHDAVATAGSNLQCTKVQTEWIKPKSLAVGPPSQIPSSGHFVFDSSMKALAPRRLRSRSQADRDAALHLRRTGGACPTHKASKKKVSQGPRDLIPALIYSEVSLSREICDIEEGIGRRNCSKSFCRFRHTYRSWASK
jgi:hypothetical protein